MTRSHVSTDITVTPDNYFAGALVQSYITQWTRSRFNDPPALLSAKHNVRMVRRRFSNEWLAPDVWDVTDQGAPYKYAIMRSVVDRSGDVFSVLKHNDVTIDSIIVSFDWWTKLEESGVQSTASETLIQMMDAVDALMERRQFAMIDALIRSLNLSKISADAMVTLVRVTYPVKSELRAWTKAVTAVKDELFIRGLDGEAVLRGL